LVKNEFELRGIEALGQFPVFHPHMTLVNLGKNSEWLSKFWPKIEAKWQGKEIGTEKVESWSNL
jgi:hypothetical protein